MSVVKLNISLILFSGIILSQTLIFPRYPTDHINDMFLLSNKEELIFINNAGSIYKSYNGGNTWEFKNNFEGTSLKEIKFINDKIGFVLPELYPTTSDIGLIYSTDAGETWNNQKIFVADAITFLPLSESSIMKATENGEIQILDNFFNMWTTVYKFPSHIVNTEYGEYEYPNGRITKFQKLPNGTILALGINENLPDTALTDSSYSFLLKSTDNGLSWDTLFTKLKDIVTNLSFKDNNTGWLSYMNKLLKSTDGGKTWFQQSVITNTEEYISNIFSLDNKTLFLFTGSVIYKTTDSGSTWNLKIVDLGFNNKIFAIDQFAAFLFGDEVLKTEDGFNSTIRSNNKIKDDINSIAFVNDKTGFALGEFALYKTTDGGISWIKNLEPEQQSSGNIEMINDTVGWLMHTSGNLYKTTNSGGTWNKIKISDKRQMYNSIKFYNDHLGILYSSQETIPGSNNFDSQFHFITTDGGNTWTQHKDDSLKIGFFDKIQFLKPDKLWGINIYGLWFSADTAKSWKKMFGFDYFVGGYSFSFYDTLFGVVTITDEILSTTDGGKTWVPNPKTFRCHPKDCAILGPSIQGQRIIEAGSQGKMEIYYFRDGKYDWGHSVNTYTRSNFNSIVVYIKDNFPNVWITGDGFNVFHREFELITNIKNGVQSNIKSKLTQNYPNPFNPTTVISYTIGTSQLPVTSNVELKIYDLLGREVITLVNEEKLAGNYQVEWNAENFSSGVYFYVLNAGGNTTSKKMILLK